jgi:hypothetical protein
MTIKKECIVKSLKSDYSSIGLVTVIGAVIIGIILLFTVYSDQFYIITQYFTAFNFYVVTASISSIVIPVIIVMGDYSQPDSKRCLNDKNEIWLLLVINFIFVGVFWFVYMVASPFMKYPDITYIGY